MEPTITIAEAARRLSVSEETVRRWIHQGHLHGFKANPELVNSPWQVTTASIETLIEKRKRKLDID